MLAQDPNSNANSPAVTTVSIPAGPPPTPSKQTGCPTVTATRELCATCPIPLCLGLATVTQSCGCPSVIPTVYLDFPCSDKCKGVWCSTSYATVTATEKCTSTSTSGPATTTTTFTVPPTYPGSTSTGGGGGKSTSSTSTTTRSVVTANAAGRMEVPWARWFV